MDKPTLIAEMKATSCGWPVESEFEPLLVMHSLDPIPPVSPAVLCQFFVVGLLEVITQWEPR